MLIDVESLPFAGSQEDVSIVFAEYGTVNRIQLPTDRESDRMRGFGFVEMETQAEEMAGIKALIDAVWRRRELEVNQAKARPERDSSGGKGRKDNDNFSQNY